MADGEAPAPKKLKTADGSPATAAVVADNDAVDLVPPSIPLIQSIEHVDAVLALPREDAARTTAFKRWATVRALKAAVTAGATLNESEVCTVHNAVYIFYVSVKNCLPRHAKSCSSVPALIAIAPPRSLAPSMVHRT